MALLLYCYITVLSPFASTLGFSPVNYNIAYCSMARLFNCSIVTLLYCHRLFLPRGLALGSQYGSMAQLFDCYIAILQDGCFSPGVQLRVKPGITTLLNVLNLPGNKLQTRHLPFGTISVSLPPLRVVLSPYFRYGGKSGQRRAPYFLTGRPRYLRGQRVPQKITATP